MPSPAASMPWSDSIPRATFMPPHLALPVLPPEVWAAGVTYIRSAEFRDQETGETIYRPRPSRSASRNLFQRHRHALRRTQSTRWHSPRFAVSPRPNRNSRLSWDISGESLPIRLPMMSAPGISNATIRCICPQSKIFRGACALGP